MKIHFYIYQNFLIKKLLKKNFDENDRPLFNLLDGEYEWPSG